MGVGLDFLDNTDNTQAIKAKLKKWHYIKHKSFCTAKEMNNRMRRHPTELENIYKLCIQQKIIILNISITIEKWVNDFKRSQKKKYKWLTDILYNAQHY